VRLLKKANAEYYREFRALFEAHEPSLLGHFDEKVNNWAPLEVSAWLEGLRDGQGKQLWESLNPLLSDFFYSNH
jgi:hypothetical protein